MTNGPAKTPMRVHRTYTGSAAGAPPYIALARAYSLSLILGAKWTPPAALER